jgi:hypothetical protein
MSNRQVQEVCRKEDRIQVIADFLFENPGADRGSVMAKFAKKWQLSVRTLDRYYADARKMAKLRILKASKARDEAVDEEIKKGALDGLRARIDYILELQRISFGSLNDKDRAQIIISTMGVIGYDFKSEILKGYL